MDYRKVLEALEKPEQVSKEEVLHLLFRVRMEYLDLVEETRQATGLRTLGPGYEDECLRMAALKKKFGS